MRTLSNILNIIGRRSQEQYDLCLREKTTWVMRSYVSSLIKDGWLVKDTLATFTRGKKILVSRDSSFSTNTNSLFDLGSLIWRGLPQWKIGYRYNFCSVSVHGGYIDIIFLPRQYMGDRSVNFSERGIQCKGSDSGSNHQTFSFLSFKYLTVIELMWLLSGRATITIVFIEDQTSLDFRSRYRQF